MVFKSIFGAKKPQATVEQMLQALAPLGIRLAPERTVEDLFSEWGREEIEKDGPGMLLVAMGGELLDQETLQGKGPMSGEVWHFDAECIEGEGSYASIVRRAAALAGEELKIEPVEDFVDIEGGKAWVQWTIDGKADRHDLMVNDDLADAMVFGLLNDELKAGGSKKRLLMAVLAQDSVIVCCEPTHAKALSDLSGLKFEEV